jgi:tetratricopeptide (TPR) repeat protein
MTAVMRALICSAVTLILPGALILRPSHAAPNNPAAPARTSNPEAAFVGARVCAQCHEREFKLWMGSHHQRAMQTANVSTVLGDFNDVAVAHGSITTHFFRRDGKFMVRTGGSDGALHDYPIKFTFGVAPLQQYLIELPGGRLQAFGIAWDSRPRLSGGQRWFDLYPDPKLNAAGGPLHWTGIGQNWNYMCADCHSTDVRKNYRLDTRTFTTSYAEIDVACEACHGPGSGHVAWATRHGDWRQDANQGLLIALDERKGVNWKIDPAAGNAVRSTIRTSEREIQLCARCHSRRSQIHEDYVHGQPAGDDYRISLLDENLYYPDGQIKDEDYEYGSFVQSKMFHAGVTCSDCHDPHSLDLRTQGNGVCLQCHAASKYNSTQHHFHQIGSSGSRCVECHMPTRTYMIIDSRRDHSLRIPRPDLSVRLGVPNACNECHRDKTPAWAAGVLLKWYGHAPQGFQQFAETLHAGQIGAPGSERLLTQLIAAHGQPAIARSSALALLIDDSSANAQSSISDASHDPSALVRRTAAGGLDAISLRNSSSASLLLSDPVRTVRIEAAETLAGTPASALPKDMATAFAKATDEYIAAQELNADRPEGHLNLAILFAKEQRFDQAKIELETALSLDPAFAPAAVNLADLDRALGHDAGGERVLREAITRSPDDASLQYALGLALIRQGKKPEALGHLAEATRLDPANARFAYVYAVALNDAGETDKALAVLESDIRQHPFDRDSLAALVDYYRAEGNSPKAEAYAKRLSELETDDSPVP